MTAGPAACSGRPGRPPVTWLPAQVDAEFAAIISRVADTAVPGDRLPAAELLPEQPAGAAPGVAEQAGRIASALFCTGRLDPSFVAFTVRRTADHGRMEAEEVVDLVAARVLAIAAGLLAATPTGPAGGISGPVPTDAPDLLRSVDRRSGVDRGRVTGDAQAA